MCENQFKAFAWWITEDFASHCRIQVPVSKLHLVCSWESCSMESLGIEPTKWFYLYNISNGPSCSIEKVSIGCMLDTTYIHWETQTNIFGKCIGTCPSSSLKKGYAHGKEGLSRLWHLQVVDTLSPACMSLIPINISLWNRNLYLCVAPIYSCHILHAKPSLPMFQI